MAVSAESVPGRHTYADLAAFPEDNVRREIIDGELIVSPSPILRHQDASAALVFHLYGYSRLHGGKTYAAPCDVHVDLKNIVEPDVVFVRSDHVEGSGTKYLEVAPDLVVEISSPSTRRMDLGRKRELYERFRIPEYWFVDLDAERVEIYLLGESGYNAPVMRYPGENLQSGRLPGLAVPVADVLGSEVRPTPPE